MIRSEPRPARPAERLLPDRRAARFLPGGGENRRGAHDANRRTGANSGQGATGRPRKPRPDARSEPLQLTPLGLGNLVFAGVALFLALVGIYGALAYSVTRRLREMGIRMALGSAPGDIFALILRRGLRVAGIGPAVGLLASAGLGRAVSSLLFGVRPLDPTVTAGVAVVLGAAALVACAVPAWHATRVDPISALARE